MTRHRAWRKAFLFQAEAGDCQLYCLVDVAGNDVHFIPARVEVRSEHVVCYPPGHDVVHTACEGGNWARELVVCFMMNEAASRAIFLV